LRTRGERVKMKYTNDKKENPNKTKCPGGGSSRGKDGGHPTQEKRQARMNAVQVDGEGTGHTDSGRRPRGCGPRGPKNWGAVKPLN